MSSSSLPFEHRKCEPCEDCGTTTSSSSFCVDCGTNYCDQCWMNAPPHKNKKLNRDNLLHEKINKEVAARYKEIFNPTSDPYKQRQLHQEDRDTTWFGVCRAPSGRPELRDYGRYNELARSSWTKKYRERWPQLVSFVGQTGSGKSTLVKILIDYQERSESLKLPVGLEGFRSPVAGSINDQAPTSGDVHLYADPGTFLEQYPVLYADCEGLDGGERVPVGAQYQEVMLAPPVTPQSSRKRSSSVMTSNHSLPNKIRKAHKAAKELRWAKDSESCKREFAVRHLYPRLLYAFSDVVIFVLRNERIFETGALVPMLRWAYSSIEGVVGQPVKPHVIIVSNFTDPSIDPKGWDIKNATQSLFDTYETAIYDNVDIKRHAEYWESVNRPVKTTKDLLLCYYSSVDVVRIPQKGRYGLVNEQVAKLHDCIKRRTMQARDNRKRLRVMFNTEEFQAALSMGFEHFTTGLDEPFDFVELSCRLNPIPKDFGGNILRLALSIKNDPKFANSSGREIFKNLGHMVASCVMLDYTRHHIKGTPARLLGHYEENYNRALVEFCEDWWPCCFENKYGRCSVPKRNHLDRHQNERGKILSIGTYRSTGDFTVETYRDEWRANLDQKLQHIRTKMDKKTSGEFPVDEEQAATELHQQLMKEFYANMGNIDAYTNHSACFCCLRELPEHPLPCGHVLCTPCIRSFCIKKDNVSYTMDHCPLHPLADPEDKRQWQIPVKPDLAGVRILTLDGGGIRGIVELEVLRLIQRNLGRLPIISFFDLIVGTSTGGLIALGLGVKEWPISECNEKFSRLCQHAFQPREFHETWVLGKLAALNHKSKWRTKPFEAILRETFQEDLLFGGTCDTARYQRKVGVVSALHPGQRAVVLTNYNRPQRESAPDYKFERPEKAEEELKVWEACRATSAATGKFKPFFNERSGSSYIDGALYYNNPATVANQERKLLWPESSSQPPDILLSIGTGLLPENYNAHSTFRRFAGMFQPAVDRFDNMLDAQNAWELFYQDVKESKRVNLANERYVRLNPELRTYIEMDDVKAVGELRTNVRQSLRSPKWAIDCALVAKRLISTSFYFERDEDRLDQEIVKGQICCRFPDGSSRLRALGNYLVELQRDSFSPQFIINQEWNDASQVVVLTREVITNMTQDSTFKVRNIEIQLSRGEKATIDLQFSVGEEYPISGFPQALITEDRITSSQSPAPSLKSPTTVKRSSTIREEDEQRPSTDSSVEEPASLAAWARGLGKRTNKPTLSTRHRKQGSDGRAATLTRDSRASIYNTAFSEPSSNSEDTEMSQPIDSSRSRDMDNLPAEGPSGTTRRPINDEAWNQDFVTLPRNRMNFSISPDSSSFAARVQAASTATSIPRTDPFARDSRLTSSNFHVLPSLPRNPEETQGRQDRAVSDPVYPYFRPDDITGDTAPAENPAPNGPVDSTTAQYPSGPLTPRTLESLSEEEQMNIAIMESMKIAQKENKFRY